MDSIEVLPNPVISNSGIVSSKFCERNIATFHQACSWVKNLPYGSNSSNNDSLIIFQEKKATCTNKRCLVFLA